MSLRLLQVRPGLLSRCLCIRKYFGSQRVHHVPVSVAQYIIISVFLLKHIVASSSIPIWRQVGDMMDSIEFEGLVDTNHESTRMRTDADIAPAMKASASFFCFHPRHRRPLTGVEKMIFQCMPVDRLELSNLREDVASQHMFELCRINYYALVSKVIYMRHHICIYIYIFIYTVNMFANVFIYIVHSDDTSNYAICRMFMWRHSKCTVHVSKYIYTARPWPFWRNYMSLVGTSLDLTVCCLFDLVMNWCRLHCDFVRMKNWPYFRHSIARLLRVPP